MDWSNPLWRGLLNICYNQVLAFTKNLVYAYLNIDQAFCES